MGDDTIDLGVLFVHGIGDQKERSTLEEGRGLTGTLGGWLPGAVVGEPELRQAPGDPAARLVELDVGGRSLKVLAAEGWWADKVPAPGAGTLLRWLFSVVPLVVPRVLDAGLRRSSARLDAADWWRPLFFGSGLVRLGQNVFVVAATLSLLVILFVLWLLAWPRTVVDRWRGKKPRAGDGPVLVPVVCGIVLGAAIVLVLPGYTYRQGLLAGAFGLGLITFWTLPRLLNTTLAQYVGDCYALLRQEAVRDAMVDRVEACLTWLEGRVGERVRDGERVPGERAPGERVPIVVVAHSQGAELVRRVIAERGKQVHGLVTYGSGIAKLNAVGRLRAAPWWSLAAFLLRVLSAGLVIAAVRVAWRDGPAFETLLIALAMLVVALAPIALARKVLRSVVGEEYTSDDLGFDPGDVVRWLDFHTANDPVAEGALPIDAWGTSNEIVNGRVLLLDHVTYWHNVEGFCAPVLLELAAVVGCGQPGEISAAADAAAADRARRVGQRVYLRWAFLAVAVAGLLVLHGPVQWLVAGAAVVTMAVVERRLIASEGTRASAWSPCPRGT